MEETNLQTMLTALRAAGYRMTPQRKAICQALAESKEHPSARMLYDQLRPRYETLSLATVYNTLDTLSRLGVINILGEIGDGDAIRYDADTQPHVNLACVSCHRILDIDSPIVQRMDEEIERGSGFRLLGARVLYYGICPECAK
jgi:Fur family transcriptional regulator, peroxide stress response regulator